MGMEENSVLVAINLARVHEETPRSEVSRRAALRPVSLTFRTPSKDQKSPCQEYAVDAAALAAVVAEVVVAELREGFQPLKNAAPPLSTMVQRVAAHKQAQGKRSCCVRQANRLIEKCTSLGRCAGDITGMPKWIEQLAVDSSLSKRLKHAPSLHSFSAEPALLYRVLLFTGDAATLARTGQACSCWQWLERTKPAETCTQAPLQYHLWQWVLRWGHGPSAASRLGFWRWALGCCGVEAPPSAARPVVTVLTAALRGDASGLLRLTTGLAGASPGAEIAATVTSQMSATMASAFNGNANSAGSSNASHSTPSQRAGLAQAQLPIDILEAICQNHNAQKMWMLTDTSMAWLARQGRAIQVLLFAHCPQLMKHFVQEGVPPELFYCQWLQFLFQGIVQGPALLRLWDQFIFERSHKVFLRLAVALFARLEDRLRRGDVEHMMKVLFNLDAEGIDPDILLSNALETKVTRSMLRELEQIDGARLEVA